VGDHFRDDVRALLAELGFGPGTLDWQVERLSSGERQRLALVRLLENRPRVLLLDEPTANLDLPNTSNVERLVRDYVRQTGAACLWVTHDTQQIERVADERLVMDETGLHRADHT
jgi:ABC-type iron transport system FetAB ATPase subunit